MKDAQQHKPGLPRPPAKHSIITDPALLKARLKELDREFARQTKQLTVTVKKIMKKKVL